MRRIFSATLFLNLFAALLFSCGEGIRLLPFPTSENAGNSQKLHKKNKIPYQPNVLRLDNFTSKNQTKIQRDSQQKFYFGDFINSENLSFFSSGKLCKSRSLFNENRFRSQFLLNSKSSRAPPFFSWITDKIQKFQEHLKIKILETVDLYLFN